jgi:hypothetical protein
MQRDDRWVGGAVLIAIGTALLIGQVVGDAGRFVLLGIGVVLLVLFFLSRNPGPLIGGGIVTGLGVGVLASMERDGTAAGAAVILGLAGGFIGVWIIGSLFRVEETRFWPLVPGVILAIVGLVLLAGSEAAEVLAYAWPIALIAAGGVVLVVAFRRRGGSSSGPGGGAPGDGEPGDPPTPR